MTALCHPDSRALHDPPTGYVNVPHSAGIHLRRPDSRVESTVHKYTQQDFFFLIVLKDLASPLIFIYSNNTGNIVRKYSQGIQGHFHFDNFFLN